MALARGAVLADKEAVLTAEWLSWVDLGRRYGRAAWPHSPLLLAGHGLDMHLLQSH